MSGHLVLRQEVGNTAHVGVVAHTRKRDVRSGFRNGRDFDGGATEVFALVEADVDLMKER